MSVTRISFRCCCVQSRRVRNFSRRWWTSIVNLVTLFSILFCILFNLLHVYVAVRESSMHSRRQGTVLRGACHGSIGESLRTQNFERLLRHHLNNGACVGSTFVYEMWIPFNFWNPNVGHVSVSLLRTFFFASNCQDVNWNCAYRKYRVQGKKYLILASWVLTTSWLYKMERFDKTTCLLELLAVQL